MDMKWLLLCLFAVCTADIQDKSNHRKPSCMNLDEILACPLNLAPVCGTNGKTYGNECLLCVERQLSKADILIVKDGNC